MKHFKSLLLATAFTVPFGAAAQELTTINVIMPLPRSANFYPLIAGEALGYFAEEGVQVNLLPSSTSLPYIAFVQNGQSDLSMLDHSEVINGIAAGAEIKLIYEVMQNAPEGMAVLAESPYQTLADLKGTTVGLVSDRDSNTLAIGLGEYGLSLDDVKVVVVGEAGPTLANALGSGQVSAISGAVPDWLSLQANGIKLRLITPDAISKVPANNFVINANRIEELREPMQGFLRAWSKGMHVGVVDPDALARMAALAVPEEWENPEFGRQFLDASIGMNVSITDKPGDPQPEAWKKIQPKMVSVGAIEAEIDPAVFMDDSFIDYAHDWSREEVAAEVAEWKAANP